MRLLNVALILFIRLMCLPAHAAFTIDASSDNIQIADNAVLTLLDADWTLAIKTDITTVQAYSMRVFETVLNGVTQYGFVVNSDSSLEFYATDDDGTTMDALSAASTIDTNARTLVVVRSGNKIDVYYEGSSVANVTNASFDAVNGGALYIGNRGGGTQDRGFIGSLAEFAKWDRALNAGEITALSKGLSPRCLPGAQVYLPLVRDSVELVKALSLTLTSITVGTAHPSLIQCD